MKTFLWLFILITGLVGPAASAQQNSPTPVVSTLPATRPTRTTVLPVLTKAQLYADFDTLYSVLKRVNPHNFVRQRVNGYAMLDSIRALRPAIDTITSARSFYRLVNRALTYCQDGHTAILSARWYRFLDSTDAQQWHSTERDTSVISEYATLNRRQQARYRLQLPIQYIQGSYRVWTDFDYRRTHIPFGATLVRCNGQDIHAYVGKLLSYVPEMHWDFANKRFYAETFTQSSHLTASDSVRLTFMYEGKPIIRSFALADTINAPVPTKSAKTDRTKAVVYFADRQLLYLRIPVMANAAFYRRSIDSLARNKPIQKIVLDIRDNPGGSDLDWQLILGYLIDKPIVRTIITGANVANPRPDRLGISGPKRLLTTVLIPDSLYQFVSTEPDTLTVDTNSLHFTGKIYVLQNEKCFSSAGSLISTCQFSEQLINVGNSTGWFAGFGSMPWIMILPHSKILYWTEPLLDFTAIQRVEDLFHNQVKIPVRLTLAEYQTRYTYPQSLYESDFLFRYDPVFRTVLNQP